MLQSIRDKTQSWLAIAIIALFVFVFILWGIHSYLELSNAKGHQVIASAMGSTLSLEEFNRLYQFAYQRMQGNKKQEVIDRVLRDQLKKQVLTQWISTQVLAQAALQAHYRVSQALIDTILLNTPAFQIEGRFSSLRFYEVLKTMGVTEVSFLTDLKKALLIEQVKQGLEKSAFVVPEEFKRSMALIQQLRSFAYFIFSSSQFLTRQLPLSDSQALAYYQQNKKGFQRPEEVSIEYIKLSGSDEKDEKAFIERRDKLADLVYIHPHSLAVATKTLGLPIYSTSLFDRHGGPEALTMNPQVLAAAFSQEVLQGNNSAILDLDGLTSVVLRIKEHKVSSTPPFFAVRAKILKRLRKQATVTETNKLGERWLQKLKRGDSISAGLDKRQLGWQLVKQVNRYNTRIPAPILTAAFRLPVPDKGKATPISVTGFSLPNGDYALVKLIAVYEGGHAISYKNQKIYRSKLAEDLGRRDYALYVQSWMKKAKWVVYP